MYYIIKDALLLYFYFAFRFYKFVFYDVWKMVYDKFHTDDDEESEDDEENNEDDEYYEDEITFCQLFRIGEEMCLFVDHVEMCPDETAFIRVVDDEGYTPLYKRKVRRDKAGNRFIVFNSTNYYLDDKKTQPISLKK